MRQSKRAAAALAFVFVLSLFTGCMGEEPVMATTLPPTTAAATATPVPTIPDPAKPPRSSAASTATASPQPTATPPSTIALPTPTNPAPTAAAPGTSIPDTQVPDPVPSVDPPENWQDDGSGYLFYSPNFPTDGSNITYVQSENDRAFGNYTEDSLKKQLEAAFYLMLGEEIAIEIEGLEYTELNGLSALRSEFTYQLMGMDIRQVQYLIQAGMDHTFTLTQTGDADWVATFDAWVAALELE